MRRQRAWLSIMVAGLICGGPAARAAEDPEFTTDFRLEECSFSDVGENPYFNLEPGHQLVLEGDDEGEAVVVQITVLNQKKWIKFKLDGRQMTVRTRVVEEREWIDDELVEVSRNYYARCRQTNDVYYFGEDVDIYEDGKVVSHAGAWRAGVDGALPGVIMPGTFLLGSRYYQEIAPGVALDRAEHLTMGLELELPVETLDRCVEIVETTPLEPGHESVKFYCAEVGLVRDGVAELVSYTDDDD